MEIAILLEPVENNGYRAKSGPPFDVSAEGATCEEAVAKVREKMKSKLTDGSMLVGVEMGGETNPWLQMAGIFDPNDPLVKEWIEIMAENRRKANEDPNDP
jgi:hypothetical protein